MKRAYTKQLYERIYKQTRIKPDPQVFLGMAARAQTVDTRPFFFSSGLGTRLLLLLEIVLDQPLLSQNKLTGTSRGFIPDTVINSKLISGGLHKIESTHRFSELNFLH